MKLRILPEAEAEIESARLYLGSRSPGLGQRFLNELSQTLAAVSNRPLSFAGVETLQDDRYRRALVRTFRYAVVFRCAGDEVIVVAVSHGSRAPNYWLGRNALCAYFWACGPAAPVGERP